MGHDADLQSSSRARGRWKLLRNALLDDSSAIVSSSSRTDMMLINCHSIHSFKGYQMLQTEWVDENERNDIHGVQLLKKLLCDVEGYAYSREDLPRLVRVLQAIRLPREDITLKCELGTIRDSFGDMPMGWLAEISQDSNNNATIWRIKRENVSPMLYTDFGIKSYRCTNVSCGGGNDDNVIYIHERRRQRTTLQDLVRHRTTGIDNTGSVCVWDAAQTLAWYVGTHIAQIISINAKEERELKILELGAGMAALSSLMILKQLHNRHKKKIQAKVFITDGQVESVENNKINLLLLHAELRNNVECLLMPWSFSVSSSTTMASIQASITLIADCTHFEEFHGELLWTMLYHAAVGGTIYLCQPMRGQSWSNFSALMETINGRSASPIVQVTQIMNSELETKRIDFESKSATNGYRLDVHHPYIFSVTKLRIETEDDQKSIIKCRSCAGRDP